MRRESATKAESQLVLAVFRCTDTSKSSRGFAASSRASDLIFSSFYNYFMDSVFIACENVCIRVEVADVLKDKPVFCITDTAIACLKGPSAL